MFGKGNPGRLHRGGDIEDKFWRTNAKYSGTKKRRDSADTGSITCVIMIFRSPRQPKGEMRIHSFSQCVVYLPLEA